MSALLPLPIDLDPNAQSELLRRQAELALQESQQRFSRFMMHLPGLAWIKDVQGRYIYANDAALKAFRTRREDLYGKIDQELFPPDVAEQFRENDRRALASETGIQTVETLEHDDGVLHHSIVSKFPIPGGDDQPALVGGMAVDITELIRARKRSARVKNGSVGSPRPYRRWCTWSPPKATSST